MQFRLLSTTLLIFFVRPSTVRSAVMKRFLTTDLVDTIGSFSGGKAKHLSPCNAETKQRAYVYALYMSPWRDAVFLHLPSWIVLKMGAVCSSETLVPTYKSIRRPEDISISSPLWESEISYRDLSVCRNLLRVFFFFFLARSRTVIPLSRLHKLFWSSHSWSF
jgi:hypothetical protein